MLLFLLFRRIYTPTASDYQKNDLTNTTNQYLESIKNNSDLVDIFFKEMPKGADLHMHIGGSEYAENFIHYGAIGNFCINWKTLSVYRNNGCSSYDTLLYVSKNSRLYDKLVQAWSMKNFKSSDKGSASRHFFSTFKTDPILSKFYGNVTTDIITNAATNNVSYMELQTTEDNEMIEKLINNIRWSQDLNVMYKKILEKNFSEIEKDILKKTADAENQKNNKFGCKKNSDHLGCNVLVKWQHVAVRTYSLKSVFAQLILSFELAKKYPNYFVGVSLIGPENNQTSLHNYSKHMEMIKFLHKKYPNVKISLHAGELVNNGTNLRDLTFHINEAIEAGASRIGHGLDIKRENDYKKILQIMAQKGIAVEISPTSEEVLWNVFGTNHPFSTYLNYNVPIVISTDDMGVLRTNMTEEYKKIFYLYNLNYITIKSLIRNGLSYSFLPGDNLWRDLKAYVPQKACSRTILGNPSPPKQCLAFLNSNQKAKTQWMLENQLYNFENKYTTNK